jgi:uncharacterized protein YukJ
MLANYGMLKARPIRGVSGTGSNPHYQVHVVDQTIEYRIAVHVKSQESPSDVEFIVIENFQHHITNGLVQQPLGYTALASTPTGGGLDFIRGNLFDPADMRPLPMNLPGPDNDLNEAVDKCVQAVISEEEAFICAFGQRWGPEPTTRDTIFGFLPGNGIHDIHKNQGNSKNFVNDDGVWQDGGLLFYQPSVNRWTAIFLAFQSQSWHTDDTTGHTIAGTGGGAPGDGPVRIAAALVNPMGGDQGKESVTLVNTTAADINLNGWSIANKNKQKFSLTGTIKAGQHLLFTLPVQVPLSNDGGIITLLNAQGLKIHGVNYTKAQASKEGITLTF